MEVRRIHDSRNIVGFYIQVRHLGWHIQLAFWKILVVRSSSSREYT